MHHELPEQLDLDWYRKSAKALVRAYASHDPAARARVHDSLGPNSRFARPAAA